MDPAESASSSGTQRVTSWLGKASAVLQGLCAVMRASPFTILLPFLLFSTLCGVGVWGTYRAAQGNAEGVQARALSLANDAAIEYRQLLTAAFSMTQVLASLVQNNPQYDAVVQLFNVTAPALASAASMTCVRQLRLAPAAVIRQVYPLAGNEFLLGRDLLADPAISKGVLRFISSGGLAIEGPVPPTAGESGVLLMVRKAIHVPVTDPGDTFGRPDNPNPVCDAACTYNATSGTKFWGVAGAMIDLSLLQVPMDGHMVSKPLETLVRLGFRYSLMAPLKQFGNNNSSNNGSSSGPQGASSGSSTAAAAQMVVESSPGGTGGQAVTATIDLGQGLQWTLLVGQPGGADGWMPRWYGGVVAAVVLASLAASLLLFGLLVSRRRQKMLLHSLLPAHLIRELHTENDQATLEPKTRLESDTPADVLTGLLATLLSGQPADLRDVVLLQTVLKRRLDVYRPFNLGARMREAHLDTDVASALMRQLGNAPDLRLSDTGGNSSGGSRRNSTSAADRVAQQQQASGAEASTQLEAGLSLPDESPWNHELAQNYQTVTGVLSYILGVGTTMKVLAAESPAPMSGVAPPAGRVAAPVGVTSSDHAFITAETAERVASLMSMGASGRPTAAETCGGFSGPVPLTSPASHSLSRLMTSTSSGRFQSALQQQQPGEGGSRGGGGVKQRVQQPSGRRSSLAALFHHTMRGGSEDRATSATASHVQRSGSVLRILGRSDSVLAEAPPAEATGGEEGDGAGRHNHQRRSPDASSGVGGSVVETQLHCNGGVGVRGPAVILGGPLPAEPGTDRAPMVTKGRVWRQSSRGPMGQHHHNSGDTETVSLTGQTAVGGTTDGGGDNSWSGRVDAGTGLQPIPMLVRAGSSCVGVDVATAAITAAALSAPGRMTQARVAPPRPLVDVIERLLSDVDSWQFDTWGLQEASGDHALSALSFFLLQREGLVGRFGLEPLKLARLLCTLESGYPASNPYHNSAHAADVLHTLHVLLHGARLTSHYLDHLGLLAAYFAAIVHDYGHPGLTNDFLVVTSHPLALRYNDRAPLESHHAAAAFTLLAERPDLDITAGLSKQDRAAFRKQVVDLVLATDMKQHFALLNQFNTAHRLTGPAAAAANIAASTAGGQSSGRSLHQSPRHKSASPPAQGSSTAAGSNRRLRPPAASSSGPAGGSGPVVAAAGATVAAASLVGLRPNAGGGCETVGAHIVQPPVPLDQTERLLSLQIMLKAADIGHLGAGLERHKRWLSVLEEEFFLQGDQERQLGLPISPLFDRAKQGVSKSQVGFYDFVALPLIRAVATAFPGAAPLLHCFQDNYHHWRRVEAETAAAAAAVTGATAATEVVAGTEAEGSSH